MKMGVSQDISEQNDRYIEMLNDIFEISGKFGIKSYVWGGFSIDILQGSLTREHRDLDCFTDSLVGHLADLTEEYRQRGYEVNYLEDFWMLQIKKGSGHAGFNDLKVIDGIANWHHIGMHGTVFFPAAWLDRTPRKFHHASAYTAGLKTLYAIKTKVQLLNPEWKRREKDEADIRILKNLLDAANIREEDIYGRIWSHNPFWYARGYEEYLMPVIVG